jgi:hypothetical protein
MALLKLNVILLAPLPIPPLPVIVMVGTSVIVFVVVMIRFPLLFCRCLVPDNNTSNFVNQSKNHKKNQ